MQHSDDLKPITEEITEVLTINTGDKLMLDSGYYKVLSQCFMCHKDLTTGKINNHVTYIYCLLTDKYEV